MKRLSRSLAAALMLALLAGCGQAQPGTDVNGSSSSVGQPNQSVSGSSDGSTGGQTVPVLMGGALPFTGMESVTAENYPDGCPHPVLKISQYPLPQELVRRMASECKALLIIEEGQPVVEEALRGILPAPVEIRGRMSGELPRTGELTPDSVRTALGLAPHATLAASGIVVPRPPALCQGCGHRDMYTALTEVAGEYENAKVFSDIGCYTLGWLSPFHAIDTCVDMGASITMAKGAADAGQHPALAVIGDSTFTHSGMTGLLDAVNEGTNITVVISDNLTTGMTGGQDSAGTGRLEQICAGLGVDPAHIRVVVPLPRTREEMKAMLREEIAYDGVSVIIPRRECIQTAKRHNATKQKQ